MKSLKNRPINNYNDIVPLLDFTWLIYYWNVDIHKDNPTVL